MATGLAALLNPQKIQLSDYKDTQILTTSQTYKYSDIFPINKKHDSIGGE